MVQSDDAEGLEDLNMMGADGGEFSTCEADGLPSGHPGAAEKLKAIQEKNTRVQRNTRQRQKEKSSAMNQQLEELKAQLVSVQMECKKLDKDNAALLSQAQDKEAELEREKSKLARVRQRHNDGKPARAQGQWDANSGGQSGTQPTGAGTLEPSTAAQEPVMIVRSCPDQVISITKPMLETLPRPQLESVFVMLIRNINDTLKQCDEIENMLKDVLLRPDFPAAQRQANILHLEQHLGTKQSLLHDLLHDYLPLYCHAFRSHPKDTYGLDSRLSNFKSSSDGNSLWLEFQRCTSVTEDQNCIIAEVTMRYLSSVKECMERRKQLHGKLAQNEPTLLEWESIAAWLASDSIINDLQHTLAKEVDLYLEWCTYICLHVFTSTQAARYLLLAPVRELLQMCMTILRHSSTGDATVSEPGIGARPTLDVSMRREHGLPTSMYQNPTSGPAFQSRGDTQRGLPGHNLYSDGTLDSGPPTGLSVPGQQLQDLQTQSNVGLPPGGPRTDNW